MFEDLITPIIELTDEINSKKIHLMKLRRLQDVLGYLGHVLQSNPHDPITPDEMKHELQMCVKHLNPFEIPNHLK